MAEHILEGPDDISTTDQYLFLTTADQTKLGDARSNIDLETVRQLRGANRDKAAPNIESYNKIKGSKRKEIEPVPSPLPEPDAASRRSEASRKSKSEPEDDGASFPKFRPAARSEPEKRHEEEPLVIPEDIKVVLPGDEFELPEGVGLFGDANVFQGGPLGEPEDEPPREEEPLSLTDEEKEEPKRKSRSPSRSHREEEEPEEELPRLETEAPYVDEDFEKTREILSIVDSEIRLCLLANTDEKRLARSESLREKSLSQLVYQARYLRDEIEVVNEVLANKHKIMTGIKIVEKLDHSVGLKAFQGIGDDIESSPEGWGFCDPYLKQIARSKRYSPVDPHLAIFKTVAGLLAIKALDNKVFKGKGGMADLFGFASGPASTVPQALPRMPLEGAPPGTTGDPTKDLFRDPRRSRGREAPVSVPTNYGTHPSRTAPSSFGQATASYPSDLDPSGKHPVDREEGYDLADM